MAIFRKKKETMRLSRKVLTVSLFTVGGFGLVYLMLFNVLAPVFYTTQPKHVLRPTLHTDFVRKVLRLPGRREGPETGKGAPAGSSGLQGGYRSPAEGGRGAGEAASRVFERGAVLVEAPVKDERKEEDRAEDMKQTASGAKGRLQGQRTGADRPEGLPDDQRTRADRAKELADDQKTRADRDKELADNQKTRADRAKELADDQRTGADRDNITPQKDADRAERVLQDQMKGADSSREVGQGQTKAGQEEEDVTDQKKTVRAGKTVQQKREKGAGKASPVQTQTSDHWPVFSKDYFPKHIPPSPFHPNFTIRWDFNTSAFLQRHDVKGQPPKLITWMVKTRYLPPLPEPVRLRVCPEMPCRLTTNQAYRKDSAALLWAGQLMREPTPPVRSHPDQVYVFHNHEPQTPDWIFNSAFRKLAWRSAFNWTMHYRSDSDIVSLYGLLTKRDKPVTKNYTDIVARKSKLAAWMVSHCMTHGQRETYIELLEKHMTVDAYGGCSRKKCPRNQDDSCFRMISKEYKFFLAFENAFCTDYISEKFFRYLETDTVVVARGSNQYQKHAPPGTFINTADFKSPKELADYLHHLDRHPEEYIQLLKAKDSYQPLYEDWPIRAENGQIRYMHYHYESVAYCEMCRRLWDLEKYRKTIPDIGKWFDKENCQPPSDVS